MNRCFGSLLLVSTILCGFISAGQLLWSLPCCAQSAMAWPEADQLFHSDPLWLGGDGAFSVDLGKERVLWLFGDSFIAKKPATNRRGARMVRNSLAIEKGYDPSKATMKFYWRKEKAEAQSFMAEKKDRWLWPLHGARVGSKLVLFYSVIGPDHAPGSLGFKVEGTTAFLIDNPDDEPDQWQLRELAVPENNWNITLGVVALEHHDLLYLFAFDEPKHNVYLARMPESYAASGNLSYLEWWRGQGWSEQKEVPRRPMPILQGGSTELSVHFDPKSERFIEVQSRGFGASTISKRTATYETGPWSLPENIYTPPESKQREPFVYAGKAHPELTGDDLIITYASNGSEKATDRRYEYLFPALCARNFCASRTGAITSSGYSYERYKNTNCFGQRCEQQYQHGVR